MEEVDSSKVAYTEFILYILKVPKKIESEKN